MSFSILGITASAALTPKHPPGPPMDLANMRRQGVRRHEINHLAASANFGRL
jgi:hypothetical protein